MQQERRTVRYELPGKCSFFLLFEFELIRTAVCGNRFLRVRDEGQFPSNPSYIPRYVIDRKCLGVLYSALNRRVTLAHRRTQSSKMKQALSNQIPRFIRFGVFELDTNSGELRKAGMRVRLQGQPLQVLVILLERGGEVVTREEVRSRIWPSQSFGDTDHALNKAIARIREALGD